MNGAQQCTVNQFVVVDSKATDCTVFKARRQASVEDKFVVLLLFGVSFGGY